MNNFVNLSFPRRRESRVILLAGFLVLLAAPALAADTAARTAHFPDWAARLLDRCRLASTPVLAAPPTTSATAGVRGAEDGQDELYWKEALPAVESWLAAAARLEADHRDAEALANYRQVLAAGVAGRTAARAVIGLASCLLRQGDAAAAQARLRGLIARSDDADVRYAATLPLALALAAQGGKSEAEELLRELLKKWPDHALSGQADSTLWLLKDLGQN